MDLNTLIAALSDPAAYPHAPPSVDVRQTHISVVFLAGDRAYKVRKPIRLPFLDFSTLERRRHDCDEEVRLNRRLAPTVYRGVVPVVGAGGRLRVGGAGEVVEWAVEMERLPDAATLLSRLERGELDGAVIVRLAERLAEFHRAAERGAHVSALGAFAVVAGNARDNFTQSEAHVGRTISRAVFDRLRYLTDDWLDRLRPLIEVRAARGVPCDTHGDLHLDHVYRFPDRSPPGDLVAIDCIEFNERFRFSDPVADMAFLAMDLRFRGRADLAEAFAAVYFGAADDAEGRVLLPFYVAYRAAVRGKVEGIQCTEPEVPAAQRERLVCLARAHWLAALAALELTERRPGLLLVGGLPGTGKSTLARALAEQAGWQVIRSDVVRKELAGLHPQQRGDAEHYSADWTKRTYAGCLRRADEGLFAGGRIIVDATFQHDEQRRCFIELARRWQVPVLFLACQVKPELARARLRARAGDASDADESVYDEASRNWQPPAADVAAVTRVIDTTTADAAGAQALDTLRPVGLA